MAYPRLASPIDRWRLELWYLEKAIQPEAVGRPPGRQFARTKRPRDTLAQLYPLDELGRPPAGHIDAILRGPHRGRSVKADRKSFERGGSVTTLDQVAQ